MTNHDVVTKLIGPIRPIGETNADMTRFENLEEMIELTDCLLSDILFIADFRNRQEFSISKAGFRAHEFLNDVREVQL